MLENTTLKVTCAACGLLCDDLTLSALKDTTICAKAAAYFAPNHAHLQPQIRGQNVSLETALAHLLNGLKTAKNPLIAGLATDVHGFRAAAQLASAIKAPMRHQHAASLRANMQVLQASGWQMTTLGEVKNRADTLVFIGCDVQNLHPRFFERFVCNEHALFTQPTQRKVIFLGEYGDLAQLNKASKNNLAITHIPFSNADLPQAISALNALILNKKINQEAFKSADFLALKNLLDTLKNSQYAVLAWSAKSLAHLHAELIIGQITQLIANLNQTTRAAGLALGSEAGDTSANYAHAWLRGTAISDAQTPNGQLLNDFEMPKNHDACVYINNFAANAAPPMGMPIYAIGSASLQFAPPPEVFIPVATVGLEDSGIAFRLDGAISLPLQKVQNTDLPTLTEILQLITPQLIQTLSKEQNV